MSNRVETCRCGVGIIHLSHERTKNDAPITIKTFPDGNIQINDAAGTYRVVPLPERVGLQPLHKNHFSDCPNANDFKR